MTKLSGIMSDLINMTEKLSILESSASNSRCESNTLRIYKECSVIKKYIRYLRVSARSITAENKNEYSNIKGGEENAMAMKIAQARTVIMKERGIYSANPKIRKNSFSSVAKLANKAQFNGP